MVTTQLIRLRKVNKVTYMVFSSYRINNGKSMLAIEFKSHSKSINKKYLKMKDI